VVLLGLLVAATPLPLRHRWEPQTLVQHEQF
jgi:hypothetical protein